MIQADEMEFPKDSLIASIYSSDASNFELAKRQLGGATLLPDDVLRLYRLQEKLVEPYLLPGSSQMAGCLYTLCSKHLVLGTLSLLRLHSTQACRETRAAVECAGIAYAIQRDPEKYKIFLNDTGDDETARRLARRTFRTEIIFPEGEPGIHKLRFWYEQASQFSHTNKMTFVQHLSRRIPGSAKVSFNYQDITPENVGSLLPTMLIWLCMAHLEILLAADVVFGGVPAVELDAFNRERQLVCERVLRFRQVLLPT